MSLKKKNYSVAQSQVIMTQLVLPNDTNQLGNLLGGQLMHWIDLAAAISAARHAQRICVTAAVDELVFLKPIAAGSVVTLHASVNRVFNSSMEVGVKVYTEDLLQKTVHHANSAYLTFVAIDNDRHPTGITQVLPESDDERRRFKEALARRKARLSRRN